MPKIYGSSEIWGDLLVTGSFSILGSASVINTTSLVVSDTIIALGHSQSGTPTLDEGLMFVRGTGATQAFIWDESDDTFALVETNSDHTVVGDISINSYSNLRVGGLTTSTIKITSGAVNGYYLQTDGSGNSSWVQLPGGLTGSGTTNYVSKWTASGTLGNSLIQDDSSSVGIGTTPTGPYRLWIVDQRVQSTKYGLLSQVEGNNFSTTNIGLFSYVSGATSKNVGLRTNVYGTYGVAQGINVELGGSTTFANNIGISTYIDSSLTSNIPIYGQYIQNSGSASNKYGIYNQITGTNSQINYGISNVLSGASSQNLGVRTHISGTYGINYANYSIIQATDNPNEQIAFYSSVQGGTSFNVGSRNLVYGTYGIGNRQAQQNFLGSVSGISGDTTLLNSITLGVTSSSTLHNIINYNQGSSTYKYNVFNLISQGESTYNYGVLNSIYSTYSLQSYGAYSQLSGSGNKIGLYHNIGGGTYSDSNYGVWNAMNGSGTKFAFNNALSGTYSDASYGLYNSFLNNGIKTGVYNFVTGTYSSTSHGVYNNLGTNGTKYGIFNSIFGTYSSDSYGMYNSLISNGIMYGLYNNFSGTYSSSRYGVYTTSTGGNSTTYGEYIILSGTGSNNYGIYVDAYSASNNYGIVVNRGDVIFNESGENYSFRVEGNTQSHLLYVDPYLERVYTGTTTSSYLPLLDYVNFTTLAVNTKSASYSCGVFSETSGADLENYGFLSYIGTSKTYNSNTGFASQINLSSATETTNYGLYSIINGTGNGSDNTGIYTNVQSVGQTNIGLVVDVSLATASNTGITVDATGVSANAIITTRGGVIFNETGGDYDFRVEGDTDQNLLFTDASTDRIGVGTASPQYKLQVLGTVSTTGFRMTNGSSNGFVLMSNSDGVGSWTSSIRDMSFGHSSISPTGSTTYYIGMVPQLQPTTTDQVSRRIRSPYRGEITSVSIMWSLSTNGSSENVTYQIHNITQATSATITSTAQLTGDAHNTYTLGSPLAVSENDDLQIRWVTPVWVTKPTSVIHVITARLRVY